MAVSLYPYSRTGEHLCQVYKLALGSLRPQPALLSNRLLVFLARDVRSTAVPEPDAGEDIEVILVDPAELPACVASGEINNATTVAALALARFGGHF